MCVGGKTVLILTEKATVQLPPLTEFSQGSFDYYTKCTKQDPAK
jgi:hypothetical protein